MREGLRTVEKDKGVKKMSQKDLVDNTVHSLEAETLVELLSEVADDLAKRRKQQARRAATLLNTNMHTMNRALKARGVSFLN